MSGLHACVAGCWPMLAKTHHDQTCTQLQRNLLCVTGNVSMMFVFLKATGVRTWPSLSKPTLCIDLH